MRTFKTLKLLIWLPVLAAVGLAQTVPDGVTLEKDLVLGQGGRPTMDLARPKTPGLHPAVLAIHGGGFSHGERATFLPLVLHLAQRGYVAATVDYRLAPRAQF